MTRDLVVLGTSSATPTRTRSHPGLFLRLDGLGVLIDPGEGTQRQMILAGVAPGSVDVIWLTHVHGDHCLGLPGVLQRRAMAGAGPVTLLHPAAGDEVVDGLLAASGPGALVGDRIRNGGSSAEVFSFGEWHFRAVPLSHRIPAYGMQVIEDDGLRVDAAAAAGLGVKGPAVGDLLRDGSVTIAGRRVERGEVASVRPGQRAAVVMDTRLCDGAAELAEGADLLITESTFLQQDLALAEDYAHLTAHQAGELAAKGGANLLVLQHYSQRYADEQVFAAEAGAARGALADAGQTIAARDLQRIQFPWRIAETASC